MSFKSACRRDCIWWGTPTTIAPKLVLFQVSTSRTNCEPFGRSPCSLSGGLARPATCFRRCAASASTQMQYRARARARGGREPRNADEIRGAGDRLAGEGSKCGPIERDNDSRPHDVARATEGDRYMFSAGTEGGSNVARGAEGVRNHLR
jgi:hypothetical protein